MNKEGGGEGGSRDVEMYGYGVAARAVDLCMSVDTERY